MTLVGRPVKSSIIGYGYIKGILEAVDFVPRADSNYRPYLINFFEPKVTLWCISADECNKENCQECQHKFQCFTTARF